jgi:hypothetical protein
MPSAKPVQKSPVTPASRAKAKPVAKEPTKPASGLVGSCEPWPNDAR